MRTSTKIALARLTRAAYLSWSRLRGGPPAVVERRGIRWTIDWDDGIDLSIALLGSFEPKVRNACAAFARSGAVVLDVGANVGALSLPLAEMVGDAGRVHAFEPTRRGVERLRANLALNPRLAARVSVHQAFLGRNEGRTPREIRAQWPVVGSAAGRGEHGGAPCGTDGARATSLDALWREGEFSSIDLVKMDVDGYESEVLEGATALLRHARPPIVMELAPAAHDEIGPRRFGRMLELLRDLGYRIRTLRGRVLPTDEASLRARVPAGSGVNVVARVEP